MSATGGGLAVTGAGGFLGAELVRSALGRGPVRGLYRTPSQAALAAHGAHRVVGDLEDRAALARLCSGAETVVHAAATMAKNRLDLAWKVNVHGTERVLRAAADAGARRLVYVSSISVLGATPSRDGLLTEDDEPRRVEELNAYARSKYEGELVTRRLARALGLDFVIVRPTNVYGPGSGPWFHFWERLVRAVPLAFGRIEVDVVYVTDVVEGILEAVARPGATGDDPAGRVVHLGHEMLELATFVEGVGSILGRRCRRLPRVLDRAVREAADRGYRLTGRGRPSLSLLSPVRYPHDRAAALLGYAPAVPWQDGAALLADWYGNRDEAAAPGADARHHAPRRRTG